IISTCLLCLNLFAKELKGMKKWDRIESLIFEEIQSIKKNKPLTEKKYYRVLELLSERLSILKKRENSLLINSFDELNPLIKKKKLSKLRALREKKYREVKKLGDRALRKKISKKMKGKILFLLGLNSRDYSDGSGLVKYLKKALRYKTSKKLRYMINVELAEHFYNEKEFSKALEHYQVVLKNTKDDWYYKHYFNASWCLFRLKKGRVALNHMERILLEEKKWKYFQNKKIVMESYFIFSSFYIDIKKPLIFLHRLGGESKSVSNYLRFAKMTSKQGLYKKTKTILEFINKKKRFELKKNKYLKANYLFFKINFLMEFKREKEYLSLLKKINKNWFDFLKKEEKNKLVLNLKNLILAYQKCVFKNNKKFRQKVLCIKKFKIVKKVYLELKRDESVKMEYFTGNIYQNLGNEKEATKSYKLAIRKSVAHKLDFKKNRDYLKKALLDLIKIQLKFPNKRELLSSLKIFLNYFPHHKLSLSFHKKMFTLHYQLGHDREVERNFEDFRKKYPGEKAIITKMVNQILNKLILKKKTDKLEFWVKKIKKEKIEVPNENFKNVLGHLASFLFIKYQKMADERRFKE
ncbi:MAG: hypothetical protein VXW15_08475, partial [Bdellovibrionota bacterium]|nr:hypothetical protein [Bdellovibrionota bacterium]